MSLRVAIQMDPIASINPRSDSTLLLGLEAQRRGYMLYYYTPDRLTYCNGAVTARANRIQLYSKPSHYYDLGKESVLDLQRMDVVLLRQDPPFDMSYLSTTYLLEKLSPKTLVVNDPVAVRTFPEKLLPTLFRRFAPPTMITSDMAQIKDFRKTHKDIVLKPLYGHGGHSVFRIKKDDANFHALMERMFSKNKEPWVVQPFLPEVKTGERRIIMIDGKVAAIIARIPAEGDIRANLRAGGKAAKAKLTQKQREICDALGGVLKKNRLLFAGVDMIGDFLIEVNLTSPTTLVAANALNGLQLERDIWDAIERHLP